MKVVASMIAPIHVPSGGGGEWGFSHIIKNDEGYRRKRYRNLVLWVGLKFIQLTPRRYQEKI